MGGKRVTPRRRVLKAGLIVFGDRTVDCTVRNLSPKGAALEVVSPLSIPDRFKLVVPTDHLTQPCHIIWRAEKRIGVVFD
jgi:hypothetical protein